MLVRVRPRHAPARRCVIVERRELPYLIALVAIGEVLAVASAAPGIELTESGKKLVAYLDPVPLRGRQVPEGAVKLDGVDVKLVAS